MKELARQRATVVFALLIALSLVSFWLTVGHGGSGFHEAQKAIWTQVIVLAFLKIRWILLDFMELRSAPVKLRLLFEGWAAALALALITINVLVG